MAETRPHITVGHHDQYGVVAATSHDNHVAEHILRLVGFERLPGSTLYGLTDPQRDPVRRGAQAVQSLRAAQYRVNADVAYDLQPHTRLGTGRGLLERLEKPSASTVTPSAQQRRSQAATVISPARAGAPLARPATAVEYRPAPLRPAAGPQPLDRTHQGAHAMTLQLEPDVAFGMHPDYRVAAAVADARPFLDEVLRKHHFRHSEYLDVYLLADNTPHNAAVRTVARATREFQDAGLSVAADPRIMIPPPVPTPDGVPARATRPGQSLTALTGELHELRRAADVSKVLGEVLDEHHGVVLDLEEFIDTAAAWCERLDTPNGHELGLHLRNIAHRVAFLGDQLVGAQLELAVMPDVTPENAPPLAEVPLPERQEWLRVTHTARARAAMASSPNRPANAPKPQDEPAPRLQATPTTPICTR